MSIMRAIPDQPPEKPPEQPRIERERTVYRVLVVILLASLLLVALVFVFPLLMSSRNQSLTSSDWSGYAVASDLNNPQSMVTKVNASWTVPAVTVSIADSYSAVWIGIGGQFDDSLIQAGTEQDSTNGQLTYLAWYELLPEDSVTIDSLTISPGDRITASISLLSSTGSSWSIEIDDATNEQSFQKSVLYTSLMLSAEWIVERPTIGSRLMPLADFGQVTFTGCAATLGNTVGTVSSFPYAQVTMYNRQNTQLVSVSPLTSNGSSFTVNYLD